MFLLSKDSTPKMMAHHEGMLVPRAPESIGRLDFECVETKQDDRKEVYENNDDEEDNCRSCQLS